MKNLSFAGILIFLFILNFSCSKETLNPPPGTIPDEVIIGKWKISSFADEQTDYTNQFAGYTISCFENGNMVIEGDGHIYNCIWNWANENHSICNFGINGCDDNSWLWQLNYGWELTNYDDEHCYFLNTDPHDNCTQMMNHQRTMVWETY